MLKSFVGVVAAVAGLSVTPALAQDTKLTFMLDFISLGRHAPWYVALDKGFFAEEGLNVEILPSKGTADAIRGVVTGLAPVGLIDVPSLVAAGPAASEIKIVASAYVEAPYCVYSLNPGANITSADQLVGLKFGSSSASFLPQIWRAIMTMNDLDPETLEVVNVDAAARVPMLAAGQIEGVDQFIMAAPSIKRAAPDKEPVCLFAPDLGLDIYSNSIGFNKSFLEANPDTAKAFVRAALKGWQYTMANRDEAAQIMTGMVESLDLEIVREEIDLLERIALNDDVAAHGFGYIDAEKMARTVAFINDNVEIEGTPLTADDVFAAGYLPEEKILP